MGAILEVRNLVTQFHTQNGVVHAVNGVSFELDERETLAIVGESGSGKSVTMLSLLRLLPPKLARVTGTAVFAGGPDPVDLLKLSEASLRYVRGGQVGFVFQDPMTSLNPVLTVGEQITESIMRHLQYDEARARQRTVEWLDHVGIAGAHARYGDYPHQFSGGMRQRVMIAMALACTPKLLIADEPTTALDVTVQAQLVDLVARLKDELNLAVIWITHDLGVVAGLADRVLVMYGGRVAEQALVDDLYEAPQHPYTRGLLGALPSLGAGTARRLSNIPGSPPDMLAEPSACAFAPRCPHAFERCQRSVPEPLRVGIRHEVACYWDVVRERARDGA